MPYSLATPIGERSRSRLDLGLSASASSIHPASTETFSPIESGPTSSSSTSPSPARGSSANTLVPPSPAIGSSASSLHSNFYAGENEDEEGNATDNVDPIADSPLNGQGRNAVTAERSSDIGERFDGSTTPVPSETAGDVIKKQNQQKEGQNIKPKGASRHGGEADGDDDEEEDWSYGEQLKRDHKLFESRGVPATRSIALAYKDLNVRGTGSADDVTYAPTVGTIIAPWMQRKYKKKQAKLMSARRTDDEAKDGNGKDDKESSLKKGERFLLRDFSGVVKPGEMMLVVGRPGSGCTTFLKALSGLHEGYAGVDGQVYYGSMESDKEIRPYRSDVVFNPEEDMHDANLLVGHTMDFALRNNVPNVKVRLPKEEGGDPMTADEYREKEKAILLKVFGLEHTHDTKVGDQYVRGVSGGEKKRVSIAEVLTAKASVQMWDNATRGLDADTALRYTKVIRTLCDVERNAAVITAYQAGNGIYNCFDKVTVIADGRVIYYGPKDEARKYFEDMGFVHPDGGNTADYLTSVTATNERQISKDHQGEVPTSAAEFSEAYNKSDIAKRMHEELDQHLADENLQRDTEAAQQIVQAQKEKYALKGFAEKTSFFTQIRAALIRDYQQRWGDQWTLWARQATTLIQALCVGSVFYSISDTTGGLFLRGGTVFLSVLYPSLISLSETTAAFSGRAVLAKHKAASMYRPSAVFIASTIGDLPIFFIQTVIFTLIIYFMAGLKTTAGNYFTYLLFVYTCTLTTTAFFRFVGYSFGTFNNASKVSGFMFSVLVTYAGYVIYAEYMRPWFAWIRWINPIYYSVEALIANELDGLQLQCIQPQLAPYGPGYEGTPAGCAIAGATPGSTTLSATAWMNSQLHFYRSHVWRNFGFVCAFWLLFLLLCCVVIERLPAAGSNKAILLYKPGGGGKFIKQANKNGQSPRDEEEGGGTMQVNEKPGRSGAVPGGGGGGKTDKGNKSGADGKNKPEADDEVKAVKSFFTWKDLTYTVQAGGKPKVLLENVFGYCKAGTLTALMGASGAGKTTLMDVLAARKTEGEIQGEVLMNGHALPVSFQRTTGYVEQVDVHLPQATVREALEFSALLRQPRSVSNKDKLAYVDVIIDLLELHDLEDALIGVPGAGLGVEQRKRLTIGVELVSRPTLLFLDEPTSGLDGQSSFLIVQFLRKLAAAGQAVLCTIHQPSASLFAQFDNLLLLKQGGKTVYFGSIDKLNEYFSAKGVEIPKDVNPAERMIDIVSGGLSKGRDWADEWSNSEECKERFSELEQLNKESEGKDAHKEDDGYQYASTTPAQLRLVLKRASLQLWRDTEYVTNKVMLHIGSALFNAFSFWMIGNSYGDLQNRLFTIFNFIFVAPGVIAQLQPKFIANRDIFEAREKKAKIYSWWAFCFGEIVAEAPYLLVCAFLYWAPWYAVVGFSYRPYPAGPIYLQMTLYEFLYTGIGQFIAAYAPNAVFAALVNPLLIGTLVLFCGVLVPYQQITAFWRYWLYYLNPFNYLIGGMLNPILWDVQVQCSENEFGVFDPPAGQTCGAYMSNFLQQATGYVDNPDATSGCRYCGYERGSEYLASLNLGRWIDGWRDICLTLLFVISSYALVFLLLKLRSKQSKTAKK